MLLYDITKKRHICLVMRRAIIDNNFKLLYNKKVDIHLLKRCTLKQKEEPQELKMLRRLAREAYFKSQAPGSVRYLSNNEAFYVQGVRVPPVAEVTFYGKSCNDATIHCGEIAGRVVSLRLKAHSCEIVKRPVRTSPELRV